MILGLDVSVVYSKNYSAINLKCLLVKTTDDINVLEVYKENKDGDIEFVKEEEIDINDYRLDEHSNISFLSDINGVLPAELRQYQINRYRYIINEGSSRSSKTYSLIDIFDTYARTHLDQRLTVWRDTKIDCKKTVLSDMMKHHKKTKRYQVGYTFNISNSILTYDTNTTIEIHGTDDEETVHGLTQDMAWLNEPYKISKSTFDQIDQRTSGHVFLDLNPKKKHWTDKLRDDPRALIIHSTFKDNPFCPIESRRKILSYQPVSYSKVVLDGKIEKNNAKTYNTNKNSLNFSESEIRELKRCQQNEELATASEFNWSVYGLGIAAEKPDKIYNNWCKIDPLEFDRIPSKSYFGLDFGETNPTALVEVKYHDGVFYAKELIYDAGKNIPSLSKKLEFLGIEKGKDIIVCDSASPDKISELRQAGFYVIGANKNGGSVVSGISFISKHRVRYTNTSTNIDYEQSNYEWEKDRYGLNTDNPIKKDDHLMDAIRYIIYFLKTYLNINI